PAPLPSFPPQVPCLVFAFPPPAPLGCAFAGFDGTTRRLRLLRLRPPPSQGDVPLRRALFAPSGIARLPAAWATSQTAPAPSPSQRRNQRPPRFLGNPSLACLALRPRWTAGSSPLSAPAMLPSARKTTSAPRSLHFGAQSRGLLAPCARFAARLAPAPRNTRFQLVASLCWSGTLTRRVPLEAFRQIILHMTSYSSRLGLAHLPRKRFLNDTHFQERVREARATHRRGQR